jgi:hypothetical protein
MKTTAYISFSGTRLFPLTAPWFVLVVLFGLTACTDSDKDSGAVARVDTTQIQVYKKPTCKCCKKWVAHIEATGFLAAVKNRQSLNPIRLKYGIKPRYRACHTAVAEGYVFEGHIPAHVIQQFLAEKPQDAIGLSVPGMPVGSPGMERGDRRGEYDVLLLKTDGSAQVYEHIGTPVSVPNRST